MTNTIFYRQCAMRRGESHQVAWIPEVFAVSGKIVDLKQSGRISCGWLVTGVGDVRLDGAYLADRSQDYKRTRKASDA
jgi:hypothetical protein